MYIVSFVLLLVTSISSLFSCDVLCIGSSIVDYTIFVTDEQLSHAQVEKGGVQQVSDEQFDRTLKNFSLHSQSPSVIIKSGGSAGIAAKGMSHLKLDVAFLSRYGNDEKGTFFRSVLAGHNIKLWGHIRPGKTARVLCFISRDGQRSFFFTPGDHGVLSPEDLDESVIAQAKIIHIEGYTIRNPIFLETLLKIAKKHHVKVSFDLGSFVLVRAHRQFIQNVVFPYVDILIGNEDEMTSLFEGKAHIDENLKGLPFLSIMLQGPLGCRVYHQGEVTSYSTDPVHPIDTTGAGDLFSSGFLYGIVKGWPLAKCASLANYLGGAVITGIGGEIPDEQWEKLLDLLRN